MQGNNRVVHNFNKQCFKYMLQQFLTKSNVQKLFKIPGNREDSRLLFYLFLAKAIETCSK
ncbi:hypothetical protein HMPREF0766_13771 [Sphingobacterium spiritivorum ATCC 33861]|uniref:DUF4372 domain-containing protein n=1 Tax=Sphingobacterium spiritivorum ATCC 33861 TaxID=525373 RepID=D7VS17_SPHSI|nr:hypothetical protein HMPREF0766_13771 [Sphingobacterium spiritivorum ATCC 33861]